MKTTLFPLVILVSPLLGLSALAGQDDALATVVLPVPTEDSTIQEAIDAADGPGARIEIAPGDYYEQLLIRGKMNLTLAGEPGTVLHATADLDQTLGPWSSQRPVMAIIQSSGVHLQGLTVDGDRLGDAYPVGDLQGIFYLGSSGTVENCVIRGFRGGTLDGYTSTRALVVWNPQSANAVGVQVALQSNKFESNENSITLAGDDRVNPSQLRTTFTVEGNNITGFGPAVIAVDGVVVLTGAGGVFRGNTITDHQYTGEGDPYSTGINAFDGLGDSRSPKRFIPLQPVRFEGNIFRNNDDHLVLLNAAKSEVINNVFEGAGPSEPRWGALALSGADIRVENNDFSNTSTGIHLFGNDRYFDGWPFLPVASKTIVTKNWFSNVPKPVQIQPGVIGLQQQDTRLAPFQPEFQSIVREAGGVRLQLRRWHDQPLVIEASSDLQNWEPLEQRDTYLPLLEHTDPNLVPSLRFYRVRKE